MSNIPSATDARVAWGAIGASLVVTSGVIWGFHASRHLPVDEPWFAVFGFLPHFAAAAMFIWGRSVRMVICLIVPWLLHDGAYLAALPAGEYPWDVAIYWRATHGLMLIFIG